MAGEEYSIYEWRKSTPLQIECTPSIQNMNVIVNVNITHNNIFAIIAGTYKVNVKIIYSNNVEDRISCTSYTNLKLCDGQNQSYSISLDLRGTINNTSIPARATIINVSCLQDTFSIQEGSGDGIQNEYLYILKKPELITSLTIDDNTISGNYVKGSAIPINEIRDLSTKDFNNVTINGEHRDIFYKLGDNDTFDIKTNTLSIPKLTLVDLPESVNKSIVICKSRSINKGINLKTSDPNISNRHFGYVISIEGDSSAGYNSVLVRKETLNKIFPNIPENIMSTTEKFEYNKPFKFERLTYEVANVDAPIHINDEREQFSPEDQNRLKVFAPTYKKVTINESTNGPRNQKILLKNIEFVKFGDKVIKLNYEPLYKA